MILPIYPYVGGAPPVIASLSISLGDPLGGDTVVITGTGFTGATAVTFGGTNAASYVVDGPTQITAVTPAKSAATVTVLVTNPYGTSTTGPSFKFWDPSVLLPMVFWDAGQPAISSPGGGPSLWAPRYLDATLAAAETWTGHLGQTSAASCPGVSGGGPSFDRTTVADYLYASNNASAIKNAVELRDVLGGGASDCAILMVFAPGSIASTGVSADPNEGVVSDTARYAGVHFGGASSNQVFFYWYDNAIKSAQTTLSPVAATHRILCKRASGLLSVAVDGGSWVSGDTTGNMGGSGTLLVGKAASGSTGVLKALAFLNRAPTSQEKADFEAWSLVRHP